MTRPLISIVIPTRDRPDTLRLCLAALRLQACEDVEILVQDNASAPDTRQIIEEAARLDPRIVYKRSDARLSQRANFEAGLAAASGDYLGIIGDDDGFCLGRFAWLSTLLRAQKPDAVRWPALTYIWPNLSAKNVGFFQLSYRKMHGGWARKATKDLARKIVKAKMPGSWESILVYHGLISRTLYEVMRARSGGTFFKYHIPDVYVHNVLPFISDARLSGTYIEVTHPVAIYGLSGSSSGSSWYAEKKSQAGDNTPGEKWLKEAMTDAECTVPHQKAIRTLKYHDYVSLMLAHSQGLLNGATPDFDRWTDAMIKEVRKNPGQLEAFVSARPMFDFDAAVFAKIRGHFKDAPAYTPPAPGANANLHTFSDDWKAQSKTAAILPLKAADGQQGDDILGATHVLAGFLDDEFGLQKSNLWHRIRALAHRKRVRQKVQDFYRATRGKA
ncbi:MAG: glycosyltransferase [Hyphomicrobiales bacterium]|nr:glycosyltransferase [Hyphomicrobiales bacterium]MDE2115271.1 glycosyltransferase family 2 protein [Hyphomicrobiales bacterium]